MLGDEDMATAKTEAATGSQGSEDPLLSPTTPSKMPAPTWIPSELKSSFSNATI